MAKNAEGRGREQERKVHPLREDGEGRKEEGGGSTSIGTKKRCPTRGCKC